MNAQTQTTGSGRMEHTKYTAQQHARAFLAMAEADEGVARRLAEADGDMPQILAIAAELRHPCTARDLSAAYDDMMRSEAVALQQADGLRATSDPGYPEIYITAGAPSDLAHACVYLTVGAPSDLSHAMVYLTVGAPSDLAHACVYLS